MIKIKLWTQLNQSLMPQNLRLSHLDESYYGVINSDGIIEIPLKLRAWGLYQASAKTQLILDFWWPNLVLDFETLTTWC